MPKNRTIKKQIVILCVLIAIISLVLTGLGLKISFSIPKMLIEESKKELTDTSELYKNILLRQIDGNFQMLDTLGAYIEATEAYKNENLIEYLKESNLRNDFMMIGFIDSDGKGDFVNMEGIILKDSYVGKEPIVSEALSGKKGISEVVKDKWSDKHINIYAIPVYDGTDVVGALTATYNTKDLYSKIDGGVFNGAGRIHIIDTSGNFILRSDDPFIGNNIKNLFDDGVFNENEFLRITKLMSKGEYALTESKYNDTQYSMVFNPLGINNWYLFCVVPQKSLAGSLSKMTQIVRSIFLSVLVSVIFIFMYIIHIIIESNNSMEKLAYYDSLTGAYNWSKFKELADKQRRQSSDYALVLLDISNFRFVNEFFDISKGDDLLCFIKEACERHCEESELFCREAADHFIMMIHSSQKEKIVPRLMSLMNEISVYSQNSMQGYKIQSTCGVKYLENDSETPLNVLVSMAKLAIQKAPKEHKNKVAFYNQKVHESEQLKNKIENTMADALARHEFALRLQPKIDLNTGELHSSEALVRWITSDGTMIYPDQFIPIFEQNGFCVKLDLYMLDKVCCTLREWLDAGYDVKPVSVNQSRSFFYRDRYLAKFNEILEKYNIPHSLIIIEITEGLVVSNIEQLRKSIKKLHASGYLISMDDFGSGYSSLNSLKDFDIDELKLDRIFLTETDNIEKSEKIMKNIIRLASDLNITTVAEGIETEKQAEFVKSINCNLGQGYLYSKPIETEEFKRLFLKKKT
ncbi:EAL domain-containing protein [Lachnospiraceae bacterium NSJ-143]|nr:EAL domain-containing protein [Lachnospiraceae bacterium NSJ-143]